jgi:hypothetical protein
MIERKGFFTTDVHRWTQITSDEFFYNLIWDKAACQVEPYPASSGWGMSYIKKTLTSISSKS